MSIAQDIKRARTYVDPRQQEWVDIGKQIRELLGKQRQLTRDLRHGKCECCGKAFLRARVTKQFCSPRCAITACATRSGRTKIDVDKIREALPLLRAGHLMAARSCDILDMIVHRPHHGDQSRVSEEVGLSRQRISQLMQQAARMSAIALSVKGAVLSQV